MTTTAQSMRITIESLQATYKDSLPTLDDSLYEGRSYSLAAAKCYAAAYAAASCYRDNMAMQFFRIALVISNALTPAYPKQQNKEGNDVERTDEKQNALTSELQASQMAIASRYGLLYYLHQAQNPTKFLFIDLYRQAHQACLLAHKEAKYLNHSKIDSEFADVLQQAVNSIGIFYNNELQIWTEPVTAQTEKRKCNMTLDVFIASSKEQRKNMSQTEFNQMIQQEQNKIALKKQEQTQLHQKLQELNASIETQVDIVNDIEGKYKQMKEELESIRKKVEEQSGKLSKLSNDRSKIRISLAICDGDCFRKQERLQTIVNLRAQ